MDLEPIGISVILPIHRSDSYLLTSINSTLEALGNQRLDYEILLLVNGQDSLDISRKLSESYTQAAIRVFNLGNIGLPMSLNCGIHQAKYRYIARMDSDDICLKNRFHNVCGALQEYDFVFSQVAILGQDETTSHTILEGPISLKKMLLRCCVAHPTMICRKSSLRELNGYKNLPRSEDYDLWLRALEAGKKLKIRPEITLHYRVHEGQQTNLSGLAQTHYIDGKLKWAYAQKNISLFASIEAAKSFLKFFVAKYRSLRQ